MPFIPYSTTAYRRDSTPNASQGQSASSFEQEGSLPNPHPQEGPHIPQQQGGSLEGSRSGSPRRNGTTGAGALRRRKSVSNTLFNIVNAIRPNGNSGVNSAVAGVGGLESNSPFSSGGLGGSHNGSGSSLGGSIFKSRSRAGSRESRPNAQTQSQPTLQGSATASTQQGHAPQYERSRSTSVNSRTPATTPTPTSVPTPVIPEALDNDNIGRTAQGFESAHVANGYVSGDPNSSSRRTGSAGLNGEMSTTSISGNANDNEMINDNEDDVVITGMGIRSTNMAGRAPLSTIFSNDSNVNEGLTYGQSADVVVVEGSDDGNSAEPPYIHMNLNQAQPVEGMGDSIVITGQSNGSRNMYDPSAPTSYAYNLANSATIGNFREYVGDDSDRNNNNDNNNGNNDAPSQQRIPGNPVSHDVIELDDEDEVEARAEERLMPPPRSSGTNGSEGNTNRTRANTLRDDLMIGGAVAMNSENNATVGTHNELDEDIEMGDQDINDNHNGNAPTEPLTHSRNRKKDKKGFYSIRLTPSIDHSSTQPYMFFGPVVRKMKPGMVISLGRYTDKNKKAAIAAAGSSEPIVFKSKVVSRKHAELHVNADGDWFVQDIKSSSGTFVNHVRLAPPGCLSDKTLLRDGDILQLGVDYRGGSEELYRCVKVKVEVNRSWKRGRAGQFSRAAHEQLRTVTGMDSSVCVICLDNIRAGQAVFVASCGHGWHYRCIRPLLVKTYPQFLCPCCKGVCDLENSDGDGGGGSSSSGCSSSEE